MIFATGGFGARVAEAIKAMLATPVDADLLASQVLSMRRKLEASRPRYHLKRGFGGVADIEFIVQYLQLAHASRQPDLLRPNLWDALDALRRNAIIDARTHAELRDAYDFLRAVEGRLRLIQNRSVGELPRGSVELERLARRLNYESSDTNGSVAAFLADMDAATRRNRAHFDQIITARVHGQIKVTADPRPAP